jgi:hypothetical protein
MWRESVYGTVMLDKANIHVISKTVALLF